MNTMGTIKRKEKTNPLCVFDWASPFSYDVSILDVFDPIEQIPGLGHLKVKQAFLEIASKNLLSWSSIFKKENEVWLVEIFYMLPTTQIEWHKAWV